MIRLVLIAEFHEAADVAEAQHQLDAFREATHPYENWNISLVRPETPRHAPDDGPYLDELLHHCRDLDPTTAPLYLGVEGPDYWSVALVGAGPCPGFDDQPPGAILHVEIIDTEDAQDHEEDE